MKHENLEYMAVSLPEDIMKEKWSGHFQRARTIIAMRLADEKMPKTMKARLRLELKNLQRLENRYTVSRKEALEQFMEAFPKLTEEDFDRLQMENRIDWIYLEGEVRYLDNFCGTLKKVYPQLNQDYKPEEAAEDNMPIKDLVHGQEIGAHIHLVHQVYLDERAVEEGKTLHVHIPMPVERDQIHNLKVISISPEPKKTPELMEEQPTVYFEEKAERGQVFSIEYAFDHKTTYMDLNQVDLEAVEAAQKNLPKEVEAYLAEELPHMAFTPYLRALAEELRGEETNFLLIAKRFYDFITTKVEYRFMRDYGAVDNTSEYCAAALRGDCGVQAMLFIALCRIAGIPAKWQSGLAAEPGFIGEHDWAQFYVPSIGWRLADPSYGGAANRRGDEIGRQFYFGNTEPYRIPTNSGYYKEFLPKKAFLREDPYDSQCGEMEYDDHGIYGADFHRRYIEVDIHQIK
ncbi:MAG: transglutaminase domain-containing protein [Firmicutes bacterium]|nr:transglutaminase domain-containing protein [Bacillota bacterium]